MALESKHSIIKSFQFAIDGLKTGITKGRNFRIQLISGTIAVLLGIFLKLNPLEWMILTITIASVIILELINTAIESVVDMITPEKRVEAKIAKDVAAASVLVSAICSIFIAAFLFLPKFL